MPANPPTQLDDPLLQKRNTDGSLGLGAGGPAPIDPTQGSTSGSYGTPGIGLGAGGPAPIDPSQGGGVSVTTPYGGDPGPKTPGGPPNPPPNPPVAPNDPFAASGGGTYFANTGQWVPNNNPQALAAAQAANGAPGVGGSSGGGAPTTPAAGTPDGVAAAAGVAAGAGGAAPITTADQVTGSATTPGQATSAPTTVAQSFQQALVNKLNPGPLDASNPAISGAIAANRVAEQKGVNQQTNALAEAAARQGLQGGGSENLQRGILADSAARQGQFAGQEVQGLQAQQDADLMAALGLGGNFLQTNAARAQQGSQFGQTLAEQARQANQAAELQRLGINTQGSLGSQDIALRDKLGSGQLNLGLLSALLQNNQFGQSLGQNAAEFGASQDQAGVLGLLHELYGG